MSAAWRVMVIVALGAGAAHGDQLEAVRTWRDRLAEAVAGANRIVVTPDACARVPRPEKAELRGRDLGAQLVATLEVDPRALMMSLCGRLARIELFRDDQSLATLDYFGGSLKWDHIEVRIVGGSGDAFEAWFAQKGFDGFAEVRRATAAKEFAEDTTDRVRSALFDGHFTPEQLAVLAAPNMDETRRRAAAIPAAPFVRAGGRAAFFMRSARGDGPTMAIAAGLRALPTAGLFEGVEGLDDDPRALRGVAGMFFLFGVWEAFPENVRGRWAARFGRLVLADSTDIDEQRRVVELLMASPGRETRALLRALVAGDVVASPVDRTNHDQEPSTPAAALLALAVLGEPLPRPAIRAKLDRATTAWDQAAYRVALSLRGDREALRASVFAPDSFLIGSAALTAVARQADTAALDALFDGGIEHPYGAIRDDAVELAERLTGQRFPKDNARTPLWRAWWKASRATFVPRAAASR